MYMNNIVVTNTIKIEPAYTTIEVGSMYKQSFFTLQSAADYLYRLSTWPRYLQVRNSTYMFRSQIELDYFFKLINRTPTPTQRFVDYG